jgi:hypothetical protein
MTTDARRRRAIETHGQCWDLLEKPDRTEAESEAMIEAALESLRLWLEVGAPVHAQRGHWMVARVAVDAGQTGLATEHALATLALTAAHRNELEDFDLAFAEEVAARAFALAGDVDRASRHRAEAMRLGEAIADEGDRKEFFRQFGIGPGLGLDA